jgi:hypothetical protein
MLISHGKQLIEGIDSIDLSFPEYISNYFLDMSKQLDPKHGISIYSTKAKIPQQNGDSAYKAFYYLHISGEYINHDLPIKDSIVTAVFQLIQKKILVIHDFYRNFYTDISRDLIEENLELFISGIRIMEFCFDFKRGNIVIADDAKILNVSSKECNELIEKNVKDRKKCLIKEDTTYYSYDYKRKAKRKSTLKLYDREKWLLIRNNEYSKKEIKDNPYILRIEFVFKKNSNTSYLTLENLEGNYEQVINRFIPYLAQKYKKYFLGMVSINNPFNYPFFYRIYDLAHDDSISMNKSLVNYNKVRIRNRKSVMEGNFSKLLHLLKIENRKIEKLLSDPPNSYFVGFDNIKSFMKSHSITPFDLQNEDNILFKDSEFILLKDKHILPKFKTIDDKNE